MELNGIPQYLKNKEMSWQKKKTAKCSWERTGETAVLWTQKGMFQGGHAHVEDCFKSEVR